MTSQRLRIRVALALFASGLLGSSLVFASMHRGKPQSIYDIVRADAVAGAAAQEQLQLAEAESRCRRVVGNIESFAEGGNDMSQEHAWALVRLGSVLEDEGRYEEAKQCYSRSLVICNPDGNPYSEAPILPLSHLRKLYAAADDVANAEECRTAIDSIVTRVEPIYVNAIELQRGLKAGNGKLLADNLMSLANLYYARGDAERADPLYAEVFAIRSKVTARGTVDVLDPLVRMGMAKSEAGENAPATEIFKETLVERESRHGAKSPVLISNLYNLGMLAYRQNRLDEADALLSRALLIEESRLGQNHPHTAPILAALAECKRDLGEFGGARACQARVIAIRRQAYGRNSHMVGAGLLGLAEIESAAGDRVKAREVCQEALKVVMSGSGEFDPLALECGTVLRRLSRYTPEEKETSARPATAT